MSYFLLSFGMMSLAISATLDVYAIFFDLLLQVPFNERRKLNGTKIKIIKGILMIRANRKFMRSARKFPFILFFSNNFNFSAFYILI